MAPPVAAVVFDLDDTLAVTTRPRQELLDEAAAAAGVPSLARETYLDTHAEVAASVDRTPIFERLLDDADAARVFADAYHDAIVDALEPVDGAADLVRRLREHYRVGLLTDGPERAQRGKLDALGWHDLFDAVVVTGTLPQNKPDARTFERVCADLDVDPTATVYVGDKPEVDIAGAAAVGLRTVQVLYSDGPAAHPDADATVDRAALADRLPAVLDSF